MLLLHSHPHAIPTMYFVFSSNSSCSAFYTSDSTTAATIASSLFLFSPFTDNYSSPHHTFSTSSDFSSAILISPSFYASPLSPSRTRSFSNSMIFSFNIV